MMSNPTPPHSVLLINESGGSYQHRKPDATSKKNEVDIVYERLKKKEEAGGRVSQRALSRAASVSPKVAPKVIEEVESAGLIHPSTVIQVRGTGAGSKALISVTKCFSLAFRCGSRFMKTTTTRKHSSTTTINNRRPISTMIPPFLSCPLLL
jgi:hypothetical protein